MVELDGSTVYERDVKRIGGLKQRVKSFAMPAIEPGAIVEYRWQEVRHEPSIHMRLQFQREFPVQKVTYHVRPLPPDYTGGLHMFLWPFNSKPTPLTEERDGFSVTTLEKVPAFHEEPLMPGEATVRPWALIVYRDDRKRELGKYWIEVGKRDYGKILKPAMHATGDVKAASGEAIEGANTDEQKVSALIRYIRKNVRDFYGNQVTDGERAQFVKQLPKERRRTSAEILKSGIATPDELNILFTSMATTVGLDARPAEVADRADVVFAPELLEEYFLPHFDLAVNIKGQWKLYDVSASLLPIGMVSWQEEGMKALLSDSKEPRFIDVPISEPSASSSARTAKFTLSEDGTLEGDVDEAYSGHAAFDQRIQMTGKTDAQRADAIKDRLSKLFPDSEIANVRVGGFDDAEQPVAVHYRIKIAGYAQRTGKRLLFQPMYFQRGSVPLFSASERKYPVSFRYAFHEIDSVIITMPAGFSLDNAGNPGGLNFGEPGAYSLSMATRGQDLTCTRDLTFGNHRMLTYPPESYGTLKKVFDEIHKRDGHTLSLIQTAAK